MKNTFYVIKTEHAFNPTSSFSTVNISYSKMAEILLSDMIDFDYNCLSTRSDDSPYPLLRLFDPLPILGSTTLCSEKMIFAEIVEKILAPLSKDTVMATTSKPTTSKSKDEDNDSTFKHALLGMGQYNTWHGQPDCRLSGHSGELDVTHIPHTYGSGSDSEDSNGETIIVEAKKKIKNINMSQLISMSVVSSFVEHNLHNELNPLVPSLMIDNEWIVLCLYDCVQDYLIISEKISLYDVTDVTDVTDVISKSTLLLIWIFINHR